MIPLRAPCHQAVHSSTSTESKSNPSGKTPSTCSSPAPPLTQNPASRRRLLLSTASIITSTLCPAAALFSVPAPSFSSSSTNSGVAEFHELPDSGGVWALDLRIGTGSTPVDDDQVAIHYYGRLAAKQGWRFDSTYDHKDSIGEPTPFTFMLGSGKVISGVEAAVRSMKVGGVRRVIIPPSQGYQNTSQEPLPPNLGDSNQLGHDMILIPSSSSLTGNGYSQPSSTRLGLPMEKVPLWELSSSISNLLASSISVAKCPKSTIHNYHCFVNLCIIKQT